MPTAIPPRIDRVLVVSTQHMPWLDEDLSAWHWGEDKDAGCTWFYAHDDDPSDGLIQPSFPRWLLPICIKARKEYGCNWILLDPDGDVIDGFPVYENNHLDPAEAGNDQ